MFDEVMPPAAGPAWCGDRADDRFDAGGNGRGLRAIDAMEDDAGARRRPETNADAAPVMKPTPSICALAASVRWGR